jgi:hypothetical protein
MVSITIDTNQKQFPLAPRRSWSPDRTGAPVELVQAGTESEKIRRRVES